MTRRAVFLSAYALGFTGLPRWAHAQTESLPACDADEEYAGWHIFTSIDGELGDWALLSRNSASETWLKDNASGSVILSLVREESGEYSADVDISSLKIDGREIGKDNTFSTALTATIDDGSELSARPNKPGEVEFHIDAAPILAATGNARLKVRFAIDGIGITEATFEIGDVAGAIAAAEASLDNLHQQYDAGRCEPSDCFLTTATCHQLGLPDTCFELSALRRLRDGVLAETEAGRAEIAAYYALAPVVMRTLAPTWQAKDWARLYIGLVLPCAVLTSLGLHNRALARYRWFVRKIEAELSASQVKVPAPPSAAPA